MLPSDSKTVSGMEEIKRKLRTTLPSLDDLAVRVLLEKLDSLGVENLADLGLLQYEDLSGVLKPVQIRKLLRQECCADASPASTSGQASSQSSCPTSPESVGSVITPRPIHIFRDSCNQNPNWAMTLQLPWEELPDIVTLLEQGKRLPQPLRYTLVRSVTDRVRTKTHKATKRQFGIIAQRMVSKYPSSLQDKIDNLIIGTGYDSIQAQLVSRNENLNRPKDSALTLRRRSASSEGEDDKVSKVPPKRKMATDSYGCVNWEPVVNDDQLPDLEDKKKKLQDLHKCDPKDYDWSRIETLMKETFPLQRHCINYSVLDETLTKDWPFLGDQRGLLCHFESLIGFHARTMLEQAYDRKVRTLNRYFQSDGCAIREAANELFAKAKEQSEQDNVKAYLPVVILCLMKFFSEKEESLFLVVDATKTATEVEEENSINWPRMVFLGDSYLNAEQFMVLVDGRVLVKRMTSFISSLAVLFGSYYVFNIQYPASAVATLEFMQRCFFEINPDKGSKANKKKKTSAVNPRVLKLIHQLSSFEWTNGLIPSC
ncbi:uncharacterized protein LOC124118583 [Haliotis rufescens]|uniref:uncharacterized protein LOC124118583 n=1 Tax=Haliotis rufescens TaxID=6454 RepID=UPI00201F9A65|nr:uncharacterized protein LOC124118583 [Haliotis rufescens]